MKLEINVDEIFKSEIGKITSQLHQIMFLGVLDRVPSYFFTIPASSSGKYHPRGDLGFGGLLRHTKAVFWLSEELLTHRLYAPFSEQAKNDIRVAILIHDMVKSGEIQTQHSVPEHPLLPRTVLMPWSEQDVVCAEMVDTWDRICNLVETHMGIWTTNKEGVQILNEPSTPEQLFVHLVDYIASRKIVEIYPPAP